MASSRLYAEARVVSTVRITVAFSYQGVAPIHIGPGRGNGHQRCSTDVSGSSRRRRAAASAAPTGQVSAADVVDAWPSFLWRSVLLRIWIDAGGAWAAKRETISSPASSALRSANCAWNLDGYAGSPQSQKPPFIPACTSGSGREEKPAGLDAAGDSAPGGARPGQAAVCSGNAAGRSADQNRCALDPSRPRDSTRGHGRHKLATALVSPTCGQRQDGRRRPGLPATVISRQAFP